MSGTISCVITAEKVELYLVGMYDMKQKDAFTIRTEQIHASPHSFSDLLILSTVRDMSKLSFSGLIRIKKNAQQSHAYQKNQNLILSEHAFVDSRPILEILADDVFCTHASTSGPLSKDQLLYLQMRGLTRDEAKNLSIEGFKQQAYDKLSSLGIHPPQLQILRV
ncbi:MAG: SufD family Fe-S cluster assembly protein [bacterium]